VLARHPGRLRAFVGVDPRWGRDGLTLFETAIRDYGFCGMKLYPPCGYAPDDKALYPFYEICAQLSLPVLVHIGATSPVLPFGFAQPLLIDRAALDFPGVDFILAHGTVHYQDECAMLCTNRPNVYLDISGFEMRDASHMRATFDRAINHKVLFGTDWPIFRLQGRQKQFVDRLREDSSWRPASMSAADVDLLFHGNAARLLGRRQVPRPAVGPVIAPLAAGDGE
jgi:predicted TIM-barrel fold metal-dependent hydrolase